MDPDCAPQAPHLVNRPHPAQLALGRVQQKLETVRHPHAHSLYGQIS